ncbi:FUSC family protein [Ktedonobacter sp. SOSP1-85]|uniref:FUSC family protein n=1 Tax=Ktedonobacter sp. SOSP1-85 TaxID=2778367 RepID=UPI001916861C|nr:FUSC family protein [Ktedonobacter sp. SOSP1-85]
MAYVLNTEITSWFSALRSSWRTALRIDRSQIMAIQALYSTLGFVIPLALGVATGHVVEGVSIAGGAASLGSVALDASSSARTRTMFLACVGIAVSAFVGSVTSQIDWLAILVIGIWGFGAGMLVALNRFAMIIGLQSTIALIILSHFKLDPLNAALQALLMFVGALFQAGLGLLTARWQRTKIERHVLATAYRQLANYASDPGSTFPQTRDVLSNAQTVLAESSISEREGNVLYGLLEAAERIRLYCFALQQLRKSIGSDDERGAHCSSYLDRVLEATAEELNNIADELEPRKGFVHFHKPQQELKEALTGLRQELGAFCDEASIQQVLGYSSALRDQLHATKKLAKSLRYKQLHLPQELLGSFRNRHPNRLQWRNALVMLRANLSLESTIFRHAIRLGATLTLATALYRVGPWPIERGYWIPLTALLVLKPDFSTTFTRGLARILGTMLGAALTSLLIALLAPANEVLVVIDAVMAYLAFTFLYANYAIFSAFITMQIVFLLSFVIPQPLTTALDRALDTLIGGVLALIIYALWPTWQLKQVPRDLAAHLDSLCSYGSVVLTAYVNTSTCDSAQFHELLQQARLARSNADVSIRRSLEEPVSHHFDPDLAQSLLEAEDTIAQSLLALEAHLLAHPVNHKLSEMVSFKQEYEEALHLLAEAIREQRPAKQLPPIKETLHDLDNSVKARGYAECSDVRAIIAELRRIVGAITLMAQLLAEREKSRHKLQSE